ncbi:MAG: hypothetical protein EXS08_09505 [Planctomycetes bacterium]|nr:hypothetical protein [Planctomycetota bacterium]
MSGPGTQVIPPPSFVYRGPDRRKHPTPRFSRYALFGGRRQGPRRTTEREGSFVDVYGRRLFLVVLWVALMNIGDSFFTLVHLQAGGVELNPVAKVLLGTGRWNFVFMKSILIGLALIVLAVHKNFHLARIGLWTAAGTYTCLVAYHLLLFRVD